jgi:hypothetical protein
MPEEVIVRFKLMGSAISENPGNIKAMAGTRIEKMIAADEMLQLFIRGYTIEVV